MRRPLTGTIGAGETAVIKLTGDARSLNDGGKLRCFHQHNRELCLLRKHCNDLGVTFIATNSADTALPVSGARRTGFDVGNRHRSEHLDGTG